MNSFVLLACLALASSTPLGWTNQGNQWQWQQNLVGQIPVHQMSQRFGGKIQPAQIQTISQQNQGLWTGLGQQRVQVGLEQQNLRQIPQQVSQQIFQVGQQQNSVGIQQLRQQLLQQENLIPSFSSIQQLQQQLQQQQSLEGVQIEATSQVAQILESLIESQLTSDIVGIQQLAQLGLPRQILVVLQARIQQVIERVNIQEIEREIFRQKVVVQEIQQLQQLLNVKLQEIQVQLSIGQQQVQSQVQVLQMQQTQQQVQQLQQQLIGQQVVRQLIIRQLQKVILVEQQQLQQNVAGENSQSVDQSWVQSGNQLVQPNGWYQTGNPWVQIRGVSQARNPWTQVWRQTV